MRFPSSRAFSVDPGGPVRLRRLNPGTALHLLRSVESSLVDHLSGGLAGLPTPFQDLAQARTLRGVVASF